jgi:hypothetical protein
MRAKLHLRMLPPLRQIEPVDKGFVPDLATQSLDENSVHHVRQISIVGISPEGLRNLLY